MYLSNKQFVVAVVIITFGLPFFAGILIGGGLGAGAMGIIEFCLPTASKEVASHYYREAVKMDSSLKVDWITSCVQMDVETPFVINVPCDGFETRFPVTYDKDGVPTISFIGR